MAVAISNDYLLSSAPAEVQIVCSLSCENLVAFGLCYVKRWGGGAVYGKIANFLILSLSLSQCVIEELYFFKF
jgi:hypothetical protein